MERKKSLKGCNPKDFSLNDGRAAPGSVISPVLTFEIIAALSDPEQQSAGRLPRRP